MKPFIRILNFLLVGLFFASKLGIPSPTNAQSTTAPRFGLTEAFWAPDEAVELRAGWERILFYWRELQPTGPDDWNTLHVREEWLAQANAQGRTVVGLLKIPLPGHRRMAPKRDCREGSTCQLMILITYGPTS